jgi:hypothetical protein
LVHDKLSNFTKKVNSPLTHFLKCTLCATISTLNHKKPQFSATSAKKGCNRFLAQKKKFEPKNHGLLAKFTKKNFDYDIIMCHSC